MHPGILSISEVDSFARATELGYSCTTPFKASLKTSNQSPPSLTAEIAAFRPSKNGRADSIPTYFRKGRKRLSYQTIT